ncbi:ArdC family protein [Psychrobacter celer]|uniref:ArdC family protein n=1 Tax=Psychrobacter celer TaxID=306572 RepID=UPI003FD48704
MKSLRSKKPRSSARSSAVISPRTVAKTITDQVIDSMLKGVDGWQGSWMNGYDNGMAHLLPSNAATGKVYSDINRLLLSLAVRENRYKVNKWVTYKQAKEEGWNVAKGQKGMLLTSYIAAKRKSEDGNGQYESYRFLRSYIVFNVAQLENYTAKPTAAPKLMYASHNEMIKRIIANTNVTISTKRGKGATYIPTRDTVKMPPQEAFTSESAYTNTLIRNLIHATGAPFRCNRDYGKRYGIEEAHAREALVTELAAAFLCAETNCISEALDNQANHINTWVQLLTSDTNAIIEACEDAQKAVNFMIYGWGSEKKTMKTA